MSPAGASGRVRQYQRFHHRLFGGVRGLGRLLVTLAHILRGLWIIRRHFPRMDPAGQEAAVQAWAQQALSLMGIGLQVQGRVPQAGPVLLVANHISWLDILVVHATGHCRFVSKADVRAWPLIGSMATAAGTLYIERESRRDALRVVHQMAASLQASEVLAVFPEGTTGDGSSVLPFHANLLQAALAADAPAQPLSIDYLDAASGQRSPAPIYVGDDTLLASLWRTLSAPAIEARVCYGEPERAQGRDRRAWASDLRQRVLELREAAPRP